MSAADDPRLRVVLAKLGLDGHDRGIKVVARTLRDAGMEVIYLGLRQTTGSIVAAAEQEDADVIGLSMHNAGHLTLAPAMLQALHDAELDIPLVIGGIVPDDDVDELFQHGVAACARPRRVRRGGRGRGPQGGRGRRRRMSLRELTVDRAGRPGPQGRPASARTRAVGGSRPAAPPPTRSPASPTPLAGAAHVVGITGAPGAGKSTLTGQLTHLLCERGLRPAVLAVDPSSPLTGGAILGDRIRMDDLAGDAAFIRSVATRGHSGGLALSVPGSVRAFDAAGYDPVIIETVGVGQVEVDVVGAADTTVVVVTPGWGDAVQANKAGLLEVADIFVVNKADRAGAADTRRDLELMLDLSHVTGCRGPHRSATAHHHDHRHRGRPRRRGVGRDQRPRRATLATDRRPSKRRRAHRARAELESRVEEALQERGPGLASTTTLGPHGVGSM